MINRIQWLAGLAAMCGTAVVCAAVSGQVERAEPTSASAPEESLSLDVGLSHRAVSNSESTTLYASYRLEAAKMDGAAPRPLDVALVVDASGSMSGEPMLWAKSAGHAVLDTLPPGSRMSVISFSDEARLHHGLTDVHGGRNEISNAIDSLDPRGATNLSAGLREGMDQLRAAQHRDALKRIFVLSDGHPNRGLTTEANLSEIATEATRNGMTITAFGVGLNFNEELLSTLAVGGEGNFHFVEDEDSLRSSLLREVENLGTATVAETELRLRPSDGVRIRRVFGFPTHVEDGETVVRVDSMFGGAKREILVEMVVEPSDGDGPRAVLDATVHYRSLLAGDVAVVSPPRKSVVDTVSGSPPEALADASVMERVRQVASAEATSKANAAWNRGDRARAELLVRRAVEENRRFIEWAGASESMLRAQSKLQELGREIERRGYDSPAARRYRKKAKKNSIEIIRGDRF